MSDVTCVVLLRIGDNSDVSPESPSATGKGGEFTTKISINLTLMEPRATSYRNHLLDW